MNNTAFTTALTAWQQLFTPDQIELDSAALELVATATFATQATVLAVLYPQREQLAACLQIAAEHQQPVYTVSSGKNWGYGSQTPVTGSAVVINLSRLKVIDSYDKHNGVIRVEAGVTQAELARYLEQQGDLHWMDCTGSSASCSVVGNTVERGFGHTVYGEHVKYVCGMEVMLADGDIIRTGLHRFSGAKAAGVYQNGLGPALDGLFYQSNLGIVLSMTLWVMPKPECFLAFYISTNDDILPTLVDTLGGLKRQGYLTSLPHIANAFRVLPGLQQFPQDASRAKEFPLSAKRLTQLKNHWQVGQWNISGALYGTTAQVKLAKKAIKKAFSSIAGLQMHFVSDALLLAIEKYQWLLSVILRRDMARVLGVLKPVHLMMKGRPSDTFLASAYWRMPQLPTTGFALDADHVGLIWCAVVAPAQGEHARQIEQLVSKQLAADGFEAGITFTLLNERCLDAVISISYNRKSDDGIDWDARAIDCRLQLYQRLLAQGYFPYRVDISMMHYMAQQSDQRYEQVLRQLKQLFDAENILSPGRYINTD